MIEFKNVTTPEFVAAYNATNGIFEGLLKEIRELSKKKPDATLSAAKVKIVNRVLTDLKLFLENEPEGKFLDLLHDNDLPQTSDAVWTYPDLVERHSLCFGHVGLESNRRFVS